jgi:hypothetical protein
MTPVENQQQTRRADTQSTPQQDTMTENPQAVDEKGVDKVIGSCNNLDLHHDIKTGLCVPNEKTTTVPPQLITVQQPLPKQNDNTGGGGSSERTITTTVTTGDNKKNSATDTQSPPSCPKDSKLVNGKCQYVGVQNVIVVKTQVDTDTVTKNFISKNIISSSSSSQGKQQQQPTFLLLLDTAQLCQIAGDTQCVDKQNQFKTLNLVTKFDATGKSWTITGQAENIAAGTKTQKNVQIIAHFYDSKGNNVGGSYQGGINPGVLKSLQSGAFNFKVSTSVMKGTPSFLRLEYQSTGS